MVDGIYLKFFRRWVFVSFVKNVIILESVFIGLDGGFRNVLVFFRMLGI